MTVTEIMEDTEKYKKERNYVFSCNQRPSQIKYLFLYYISLEEMNN